MRSIKLIVEYDGTLFKGFARQPGERTVQAALEEALSRLCNEKILLKGASRTDSGVHSLGQTVGFKTSCRIPATKLAGALRAYLPEDIVIRSASEEGSRFDPRHQAKKKLYSYFVFSGAQASPMIKRYVWRVSPGLDVKMMRKAARLLGGKKDFSSFAARDKRRPLVKTVRNIHSIRISEGRAQRFFGDLSGTLKGKIVKLDFLGDSFLYKMVRTLVGTLVEVGQARIKVEDIPGILRSKKRQMAGRTAPAKGLFLVKVYY